MANRHGTRYVSPGEAVCHVFSFSMQDKSHSVERLPVHTADFQQVVFEEGREEEALARAEGDRPRADGVV